MSRTVIHLPAVALRGMTILPGMVAHFDISRDRSIHAIEEAMVGDQKIFLITQQDASVEEPARDDLYQIGVIAEVKQVIKMPNEIVRVLVEGLERGELASFLSQEKYLMAEVILFDEKTAEEEELMPEAKEAMLRCIRETVLKYQKANGHMSKEFLRQVEEQQDVGTLMQQVAYNLPLYYIQKQKILEAVDLTSQYETLMAILLNEVEVISLKNEFQAKVKERVDKNQKEYLLREQMKLIREELGEDNTQSDAEHFLEEVKKLKADKTVKERIKKEIERFKNIASSSSESAVSRGYIETLLELPWNKASKDNKDLANAEKILDEDHYGLEKVKERMLEFLAVRNLTHKGESPIICLVGPPGTGKTSIARSVAKALNKKYVRICLGGVRDEAEIRGHRKTYVGAMPGRIINGLKSAGVKNPLMLLDEIDKVSSDYKGDTASALLEVLDGEQNINFRDHYLEVPMDLSEVFFIATANDLSPIPKPLLDRMEIIELSSYTENEKFHIAENYLIKKQRKLSGLTKKQVSISEEVVREVIHSYTREAGVRNLERTIGQLMHKAARKIVEGEKEVDIKKKSLKELLGPAPFEDEDENLKPQIGVVRGLAWTSVGGDTLSIEVNVMPGKGKMELTGCMGDVMKESAQIGLSYVRSIAESYGIDSDYFEKHDIHLHIPEGAVPKDGPSAGITMALAILSAITEIPVRGDIAMTGEITLRGKVLPIGGLKEKLLAAKIVGVKEVLVPARNKRNVAELDEEIISGLKITYVEEMNEVIKCALKKEAK